MKLSVFRKYYLTTAVIFLICFTFIFIVLSVLFSNLIANETFDSLDKCSAAVERVASTDTNSINYGKNLYSVARAVCSSNEVNIIITDNSGNPTVCTCDSFAVTGKCSHTEKPINSDILLAAKNQEYKCVSDLGGIFDNYNYCLGKELSSYDGTNIGYIFATDPEKRINDFFSYLLRFYCLSVIIPLVIMFVAVYFMTYSWTKPLKQLSDAAKRVAAGDYSKPVPVVEDNEIGEVCRSFNSMTEALMQLETMRRDFIGNVSHELKTPITTIGGFVDGMIDGTVEKEDYPKYLVIISNETKRLTKIIQNMLSLSKLESGREPLNKEIFSVSETVLEVFVSQEQRIEKKNLSINRLDKLPNVKIFADKDLIHQAIYNLCDNAIKFSDAGGNIDVSIVTDKENCYFYIRNTGYGIPKKDLPHIFERFYKSDKSRSEIKDSTGLGLYLVKLIANLHNGNVEVNSVIDAYTEFVLKLPFAKKE